MGASSAESPELERASTASSSVTIPRSPCAASVACRKCAGLPVEDRVAAILAPIRPDLPTPVTTMRRAPRRIATASSNEWSSEPASASSEPAVQRTKARARSTRGSAPSVEEPGAERAASSVSVMSMVLLVMAST